MRESEREGREEMGRMTLGVGGGSSPKTGRLIAAGWRRSGSGRAELSAVAEFADGALVSVSIEVGTADAQRLGLAA